MLFKIIYKRQGLIQTRLVHFPSTLLGRGGARCVPSGRSQVRIPLQPPCKDFGQVLHLQLPIVLRQGRTGTENRLGQFPTTTLPTQPNFHSTGPTLAKSKKSPALHTKITLFITSTLPAQQALPKCKHGQSAPALRRVNSDNAVVRSTSEWLMLREALQKWINTIQYIVFSLHQSNVGVSALHGIVLQFLYMLHLVMQMTFRRVK